MSADDPFDLERFVRAQESAYDDAISELRAGKKRSHWMWFIFPQMEGLGHSEMARRYAIHSADEARAYLAHPVLGPRLRECVRALLGLAGCTAHDILGTPDDLKFRSSLTLFAEVSGDPLFADALDRFYRGARDERTLQALGV